VNLKTDPIQAARAVPVELILDKARIAGIF
jgi:hypothetical protein